MAGFCGTLAVGGLSNNDYQRQEVSSLGTYMGIAAYASFDGAKAGASFCMVPYAAEAGVAAFAPYGMRIAGTYATSEMLVGGAMLSGYTVTFSNMTVKINDYSAGVLGRNIMEDAFGQENYQMVKSVSQFGSDTIFMMGMYNPNLYRRNNYAGNIRQYAMYNNSEGGSNPVKTDFIVSPNGIVVDANINASSIPETQFTVNKLQHEYKHAGDFGITGNWNNSKAVEYQQAIESHISSATDIFISKYKGDDVYVYFNSRTQIGAYVDYRGSYVGGWKFSQNQINYHMNNGIKLY